jgi:hypothetical protein
MSDISWHDIHLMGLLGFTAEDLEACREGHLSSAQQFKLRDLKLKDGVVQQVSGPITINAGAQKYSWYLICGKTTITITDQQYYSFIVGDPYHLYYVVSHSSYTSQNILVAAEYLGIYRGDDYPNAQLRDFFHFSEEDLDANRLGTLSAAQFKPLNRASYSALLSIFLGFVPLVLTAAVLPGWLEMCPAFTVSYFCFLLSTLYFVWISNQAHRRKQVDSVMGYVDLTHSGSIAVKGKRTFHLEDPKAWSFIPGEVYTLYYVPYHSFFFDRFAPVVAAEHHPWTDSHTLSDEAIEQASHHNSSPQYLGD